MIGNEDRGVVCFAGESVLLGCLEFTPKNGVLSGGDGL